MKLNLSDVFKIPNLITLVRVVLVPYIIWALQSPDHAELAFWLFAGAASTDYLDGKVARRFNQGTNFGMAFDPIADKLLLSSMFIALSFADTIPWWLVLAVVGRDVYLLLAAIVCVKRTSLRAFPPSDWGKLSTAVQITFVAMVLMSDAFHLESLDPIIVILAFAVVGLAIWTGYDYTRQGIRRLREKRV